MPSDIDLTWAQSCRSIRLQLESEADRWCDNPGTAQAATIAEQGQTGRAILARSAIRISIYSTSLISFHWWIANVKKLSSHLQGLQFIATISAVAFDYWQQKRIVHSSIFVLISAPVQMIHATKLFPSWRPAFWWSKSALDRIGFMGNFWSLELKYQRHQSSRASPWVLGMRGSRFCRSTVEYCLPHQVRLPIYTFSFLLCLCL